VSTAPPSSSPRPLPPRGTDETFFWLLAAAFLVVVGLVHALFIGVALFQSVAAIPIAHRSPDKVGIIATAAIRMVTLLPAVALLRVLDQRFGLVGDCGSAVRVLGALVVAGTVEWWLFLTGVRLVDWCRGVRVVGKRSVTLLDQVIVWLRGLLLLTA
jgi:hypothetical protein